jgi:EAL domain-containing protein (putative c-di-GMP-specific phosphodiesterase class I)
MKRIISIAVICGVTLSLSSPAFGAAGQEAGKAARQEAREVKKAERMLEKLHERDVEIAIDDCGTGESSFSYLSTLPVDMIKMDRSFLQAVPADERANRTLSAMTAMAEKMQMELIVEGVETTDQQHFLKEIGCPLGQGYHLARPVPATECEGLIFG